MKLIIKKKKTLFESCQFFAKLTIHALLVWKALHSRPNFYKMKIVKKKKVYGPTIILEKASGGSILTKLKSPDPKWTPTKRMISLIGTAFGMKYLHSMHIIHRDLKSGNVLLDDNLHPKITDFGLSKVQFDNQQSLINTGTLPYMAPELFESTNYTNSVDVYAFSIMAYEIITLKVPFPKSKTQFNHMKALSKGIRPIWPDDVNPKLKELISKCWDSTDTARPNFGEIFDLLKKPEYLIEGVDLDEYNKYINSLNDKSESLSLEPEVKSVVDKALAGDTKMMLEAANGFFEGHKNFPYNEEKALHFYRMHSLSVSKGEQKEEVKSDEMLLNDLSSDVKNIIEKKKTPDELFEISNLFKKGTYPFPQNYQLSLYFMSKAFEEVRSSKSEERSVEIKDDDFDDIKLDVIEKDDDYDDDDNSGQKEVNYLPICTQILISKLNHINILVYGQDAAVSPIIEALTTKQSFIKPKHEDHQLFNCSRIVGKGIFLYYPKDCDNISSDDVFQFINERQNSSKKDDKILMCIYCVSPSIEHTSNDVQIILSFAEKVYTTVFVSSVEEKSVVLKLKKDIKGRIYKREKMLNSKKLKESTLIFDVNLYPQNSHSHLVQEFVDIVPSLSII